MKAYERVNVEVVKFEAQDVITASVAAPVECICIQYLNKGYQGGEHSANIHYVIDDAGNRKICNATEHKDCPIY